MKLRLKRVLPGYYENITKRRKNYAIQPLQNVKRRF